MILRRRSLALTFPALLGLPACAGNPAPRAARLVPAEALTNEGTIRARCQDPEGVLAGRALCVLKDAPRPTH